MVFYSHGCYLGAYGGGFFCYRYEVGDNCLFNIDCFFVIPLIVYIRGNLDDVRVKYMLLAVLCIVVGVRQDVSGTEMICHAVVRSK